LLAEEEAEEKKEETNACVLPLLMLITLLCISFCYLSTIRLGSSVVQSWGSLPSAASSSVTRVASGSRLDLDLGNVVNPCVERAFV
jgi:hypothetical protein